MGPPLPATSCIPAGHFHLVWVRGKLQHHPQGFALPALTWATPLKAEEVSLVVSLSHAFFLFRGAHPRGVRAPLSLWGGSPVATCCCKHPESAAFLPTICCLLFFPLEESPDIICREEFRSLHGGKGTQRAGAAPWSSSASQASSLRDAELRQ